MLTSSAYVLIELYQTESDLLHSQSTNHVDQYHDKSLTALD